MLEIKENLPYTVFFNHSLPVGINGLAIKPACADKPVYTTHAHACTHRHMRHVLQTVENAVLLGQAPANSLNWETQNASKKTCDLRSLLITFLELGQQSNFQANQLRQLTAAHSAHQPKTKLPVEQRGMSLLFLLAQASGLPHINQVTGNWPSQKCVRKKERGGTSRTQLPAAGPRERQPTTRQSHAEQWIWPVHGHDRLVLISDKGGRTDRGQTPFSHDGTPIPIIQPAKKVVLVKRAAWLG